MLPDDLGTGHTNQGNGNDFIEISAIDKPAKEGMAFDNAYACPNRAPSRAVLLTDLYVPRPDNIVDNLNGGGDNTLLVGSPQGRENGDPVLPPHAIAVGETLQSAGYKTGHVGKFDVAESPEVNLLRRRLHRELRRQPRGQRHGLPRR